MFRSANFLQFSVPHLLLIPDLGHLLLLVLHHVLIELLMCPEGDEVIDLGVEGALFAFLDHLLMALDFDFKVSLAGVVDQLLVMLVRS